MVSGINRAPDGCQIADDARGCLVMGDEHSLDRVILVGTQPRLEPVGRGAGAPGALQNLDIQPVAFAKVDPPVREHAVAGHQHFVAGRQRVGHCRLPAASAAGRKGDDLPLGRLEDRLEVVQQRAEEIHKVGRAMVGCRHRHRHPQAVGHIGRARNEDRVLPGQTRAVDGHCHLLLRGLRATMRRLGGICNFSGRISHFVICSFKILINNTFYFPIPPSVDHTGNFFH